MPPASPVREYTRHRTEQALLYKLVERYYPEFESLMTVQGKPLPAYIRHEFNDFLMRSIRIRFSASALVHTRSERLGVFW